MQSLLQELKATSSSPAALIEETFIFVALLFLHAHGVLIAIRLPHGRGGCRLNSTGRRCCLILHGAHVVVLVRIVIWLLRRVSELGVPSVRARGCGVLGVGTAACCLNRTPHARRDR